MSKDFQWEISPKSSLLNLGLREVWAYRDLLFLLVRRDFVSFYKQTIFGPLWFFIQPIFTMIVFTFVFGNLAGISTDGLPQPLFYLAGITAWNYFADCLLKTSTVFRDNVNIFGKVYFPRVIVPLSIVFSNLVRFVVQFVLFLALMFFYYLEGTHFGISLYALLFPVLILLMALQGLGIGMIVTSLTTKYRDLSFLLAFGIQLMMYATTVIYPVSSVPLKYRWIVQINPMTPLIETFRFGFLGKGDFSWVMLSYSALITVLILFAGMLIFNKVEKSFVDTV